MTQENKPTSGFSSPLQSVKGHVSEFFKFTTERPVAILMVVIGIIVFGWISYEQLPLNLMPDITYPSLTVRTEYPGTAPEEIETTISRPLEQGLGVVNHLVSISSISKAGQSDVKLEFTWDTEMDQATADVREKLDQVFLPEEARRPLILRYDPSLEPIMRLGLYGDASLFYLRYLAEEDLKRIFETIEGVAAVKIKGGLEEEIRVEVNEQQLTLIGINIQQIKNRLAQENVNLAGGNLREGQTEYLVRTLNEFKSVEEIADLVIGTWNGKEIKIRDIGEVKRTNKDREIITRINGKESVEIEIYKEADANLVAVANRVAERVFGTAEQQAYVQKLKEKKERKPEKVEAAPEKPKGKGKRGGRGRFSGDLEKKRMTNFIAYNLPKGVKIDLLSDRSVFIENSVNEVKSTAVMGGILAVIVLFLFLRNLTATLIIGISIPISIIATFAPMKIFSVSLNIMSLGGLALGIGMLVDNSIVVLESISRCREEGDNLVQATIRGVGEVGGAVFASTLTTVAVFFPIVFVEGVAGQIFGDMALTVVFSLLASLAVALFVIPMLASRETSKFTMGMQSGAYFKKHIFSFSTEGYINQLVSQKSFYMFFKNVPSAIITLFKTFVLILWKNLKVILALIITLGKIIFIVFISLLLPITALLRVFGLKDFKLSEWLLEFSAKKEMGKITFIKEIWETYLVNNSFPDFYDTILQIPNAATRDDLAKIKSKIQKFSWPVRVLFLLVTVITPLLAFFFIYYLTRPALMKIKTWYSNGNLPRRTLLILVSPFIVAVYLIFSFIRLVFYLAKYLVHTLLEIAFRIWHFFLIFSGILLKGIFLMLKLIFSFPAKLVFTIFTFTYNSIETLYPKILGYSLNNRGKILGTAVALFAFTVFFIAPNLGSELIPEVHQGEFNVEVTYPVGTPVETTDLRSLEIQEYLNGEEGVAKVAAVAGTDKTANQSSEEGEHTAKLTVNVRRASSVVVAEENLVNKIRRHMANFSGMQWRITRPVLFSFKTPIELELHGYNLSTLQRLARKVEEELKEIPGLFDVESSVQRGNPEVQIIYNRPLLARYGLNVADIAAIIRNKVRGDVATEFKEKDRKIDILVRLREKDKQSINNLRRLVVNPGSPKPIPLEAIADIRINEGPAEIRRVEQQRTALITANISGRDLRSVSEDIYQRIQKLDFPPEFTFQLTGQNKEMETSMNSLKMALALAIFLVYIVMASQFESLIHPFVIIFTIPLALIGVFTFLYLLSIPLSIVVFLGMIMLAGIVVNNAIVLVDYINHLRERGLEKVEAIKEAGKIRLRPIIMTTMTTVLGLLPMALGFGDGAEIRTPMAITVIVGLITSTILTLVVIPVVYDIMDRRK